MCLCLGYCMPSTLLCASSRMSNIYRIAEKQESIQSIHMTKFWVLNVTINNFVMYCISI